MADGPELDRTAPIQFVVNAAAGSSSAESTRQVIESALREENRRAELHFCSPAQLPKVARRSAEKALSLSSAVVAVGGDGTLNTVAQAAHVVGCTMGVVPLGTFNYFARTHGVPTDPAEATRLLLHSTPLPVQVAGINDHVFLVNASLGLYPDLLEDREAFKARFGRSRWVALCAAAVTLLRAQRHWQLRIEQGGQVRDVRTLTLFVGNNRLQLEQFGVQAADSLQAVPRGDAAIGQGTGRITAVMLRPVGTLAMIALMLRGAMGTLGDADSVEHFEFERLVVRPARPWGRRVKVAFDGEVTRMRAPLVFSVLPKPLFLLRRPFGEVAAEQSPGTDGADA